MGTSPADVRVPFTVTEAPTRAALDVTWDDGFVAALDGVEVAAENEDLLEAEAGSASYSLDPRSFEVGDHVLALTALDIGDDDLLLDATVTASRIEDGEPAMFTTATPGEPKIGRAHV